jgi:hypothetical protein
VKVVLAIGVAVVIGTTSKYGLFWVTLFLIGDVAFTIWQYKRDQARVSAEGGRRQAKPWIR